MPRLRAVDEGAVPASALATSRLFVLPVATRRWVLTDNSNLVSTLKSTAFDQSPACVLLREARQLIQLDFADVEVLFIPDLVICVLMG